MKILTSANLTLAVLLIWRVPFAPQTPKSPPALRVTKALAFPWSEKLAPDIATSDEVRRVLDDFEHCEKTFQTRIERPNDPNNSVLREMHDKYVALERMAYCLFDGTETLDVAHEFATTVGISYETEGLPEPFLAEADTAERFLRTHRRSPLRAYAALYAATRNLCAASAMAFYHRPVTERRAVSRAAINQLKLARQTTQPLVRIAAEYLLNSPRCPVS